LGSEENDEASRFSINEKTQLGPLPSIPPGFTRGLRLKSTEEDLELEETEVDVEEDVEEVTRSIHLNHVDKSTKDKAPRTGFEEIDDLLPEQVRLIP
jgi:hypothetical protein